MAIVYPNGSESISVPAGESIAVFTTGDSFCRVYQLIDTPNHPSVWKFLGQVSNTETVFGPFTNITSVRIDAGADEVSYAVGSSPVVADTVTDITAADATFYIKGAPAAQGGAVNLVGGVSSTSGNAGGAAYLTGGAPGATGVGGAAVVAGAAGGATSGVGGVASVTGGAGTAGNSAGGVAKIVGGAGQGSAAGGAAQVTGGVAGATGVGGAATIAAGIGGATSGAGGVASIAGGAGTAGNSAGGVARVIGGAGQGTASGGAAQLTGGASGAGATGTGGAANVTGGAAASTNGDGGSIVITPGAKAGTGIDGVIRNVGIATKQQAAPSAMTVAATITTGAIRVQLIEATHPGGAANVDLTLPTGTVMDAAMPAAFAASDSIDLSIINIGSAAAADTYTLVANTDFTIVGNPIIQGNHAASTGCSTGTFRLRKSAANTYVAYRIS